VRDRAKEVHLRKWNRVWRGRIELLEVDDRSVSVFDGSGDDDVDRLRNFIGRVSVQGANVPVSFAYFDLS